MKVAFIHYHLKPGGVTTVLRHQLEVLSEGGEGLVISGIPPADPIGAPVVTIPALAYDSQGGGGEPADAVADAVEAAIRAHWPAGCDLLHVHNPLLAKNRRLPAVLEALQRRGLRLLLQVHDFAEDGRPQHYTRQPYPADCHYAVVNSRDHRFLRRSGLSEHGLHLLPNMIAAPPAPAGPPEAGSPQVLYPVRAIRRKNIGEAVLLSCYFPGDCRLAVTLPPNSERDRALHATWQAFARRTGLKAVFDVGLHRDFGSLLAGARFILTTSIMEGFGFSFLEPWAAGKLVWGRRLPEICRDFEDRGVCLGHLYNRLDVPLAWIAPEAFEARWRARVHNVCRSFGLAPAPAEVRAAFGHITRNGRVDFGLLDEDAQRQVIARVHAERPAARRLAAANPFLQDPGRVPDAGELVRRNRAAVLAGYNRAAYRGRLVDAYRRVIGTTVRQRVDKAVLLAAFLDLKTFGLLKWGAHDA
ncbi:MAG: hypothetical protein PVI39_14105 [Desulfobacteraceae bacterium]|jgi:hypothetical protein